MDAAARRELFQAIHARAKKELVPQLRLTLKKDSTIHKVINYILNLVYPKAKQDSYLKGFITTLGYTVALLGNNLDALTCWETLCHEIKHTLQAKKWTRVLFGFLYLWPVSQGIVLLLTGWVGAIWIPGWWKAAYLALWSVVTGIHFIPQLPDPWRERWELQAYSITMHLSHLTGRALDDDYIEWLVGAFHSMAYYIMSPDEARIRSKLKRIAADITNGQSPVKEEPIVRIAEEEYARLAA